MQLHVGNIYQYIYKKSDHQGLLVNILNQFGDTKMEKWLSLRSKILG